MHNVTRKTVFSHDGIEVHLIDKAAESIETMNQYDISDSMDAFFDKVIPTLNRCPEYSKMFDIFAPMISITAGDRYFDCNRNVHLWHGSCIINKDKLPFTPSEFRKSNPDLEFWLNMDELKKISADIPVLGMHVSLDNIQNSAEQVKQIFNDNVMAWTSNNRMHSIVVEHFHVACMLADLSLLKGRHQVLSSVLLDELKIAWPKLVDALVELMTWEVLESYEQRNRIISSVITNWLDASSYKRITRRIVADYHSLFIDTAKMKLFTELEKELNQIIFQVVENAK